MLRPRVSMGSVMVAVLVVAVDLAAIRTTFYMHREFFLVGLTLIPTSSILLVATGLVVMQLWRRGEAQPYLFGLIVGGGIGLLSMAVVFFLLNLRRLPNLMGTLTQLEAAVFSLGFSDPADKVLLFSLYMFGFALPQVIFAALGAALTSRFGITIVARGRAPDLIPDNRLSAIDPVTI